MRSLCQQCLSSSINAINYCNASPIFMDVNNEYCLDIKKTIEFIRNETYFKNNTYNKTTKKKLAH